MGVFASSLFLESQSGKVGVVFGRGGINLVTCVEGFDPDAVAFVLLLA